MADRQVRFVVEIPAALARAAAELVESGEFASVDEIARHGMELALADRAPTGHGPFPPLGNRKVLEVIAREHSMRGAETGPRGVAVVDTRDSGPWIWGMVNRVFPLKLTARVCAGLCVDGPTPIESLQARSVACAQLIGKVLKADDDEAGRRRNEARSVGFPLRKPLARAGQRYADHFAGRVSSDGTYVGGVFEVGLVGPVEASSRLVAPTEVGWRFALLENPVLDGTTLGAQNLSTDESRLYLREVATSVGPERSAFLSILAVLATGPVDPQQLAARTTPTTAASVAPSVGDTARAGAVGRLIDLGAAERRAQGRSASLSITDLGREALDWLAAGAGRGPAQSANHRAGMDP